MIHALLFAVLGHDAQATQAQTIYRRSQAAVVTVFTPSASGTGFVVGDGSLVVTCYHVVRNGIGQVSVVGKGKATLVASNPTTDVAVLRLAHRSANRLLLSQGFAPTPGAQVYVIGTPLGLLEKSITEGMLSGVRHLGDTAYLQITAPISHGSSGSPVLDAQGRVIGMAASSLKDGQALNFAISAFNLRQTLAMVATGSRVVRRSPPPTFTAQKYAIVTTQPTTVFAAPDRSSAAKYSTRRQEMLWVSRSRFVAWLLVSLPKGNKGYIPAADTRRATTRESRINNGPPAVSLYVRKLVDKVIKNGPILSETDRTAFLSLGQKAIPIIAYELRKPGSGGKVKFVLASVLAYFGVQAKHSFLDMLTNGNRFEREAASYAIWEASLDLISPDRKLNAKAEKLIGFLRTSNYVEAIVSNLRDEDCGAWLFPAIGNLKLTAAREPLLTLLNSKDFETVQGALSALSFVAKGEDVEDIEGCVNRIIDTARKKRQEEHPYDDDDLERTFTHFSGGTSKASFKILSDYLSDPDEVVRVHACSALGRRGGADSLRAVLDLLHDEDIVVRCVSLESVALLGDRDHIDLAIHYCRKGSADEKYWAVRAIGAGKWTEGIDAVLDLVSAEHPDIRRAVATSLGQLGGERAKNALQTLRSDSDPNVRRAALDALEQAAGSL